MERFRLPSNVTGLTMRDGTKLDADKRGIVEVPHRYRQDALDASSDTLLLSRQDSTLRSRAAEKECVECGFVLYAWQGSCPKCETIQPCCELDHDGDGNCPRHPE